jgi:hypothetical protein
MALTKIMGQHFRVFVGGNAVPEAVNCSVTINGSMEDSTTKDTVGSYVQEQMTSKDWNVSVENLDASLASLRALITRFNSDAKVTVGWDQTGGTQNRVAQNAPFARSGQAILNDLSIQANNRTNIQVSCQYQGSGALA